MGMFDPDMFDPVMFETGEAEDVIDDHAFAGGLTIYKVAPERWG